MPNEPLFEVMETKPPFNIRLATMKEISEQFYANIKQAMKILERGGCAAYEHSGDGTMYYIQKRGKDRFAFQDASKKEVIHELSANDILNILFSHAPFTTFIGEELGKDLKSEEDKYVTVYVHKGILIQTLKEADPFKGDKLGYIINHPDYDKDHFYNRVQDAIEAIDEKGEKEN